MRLKWFTIICPLWRTFAKSMGHKSCIEGNVVNKFGELPDKCDNCWETILNNPPIVFEIDIKSLSILVDIHRYTLRKRKEKRSSSLRD